MGEEGVGGRLVEGGVRRKLGESGTSEPMDHCCRRGNLIKREDIRVNVPSGKKTQFFQFIYDYYKTGYAL